MATPKFPVAGSATTQTSSSPIPTCCTLASCRTTLGGPGSCAGCALSSSTKHTPTAVFSDRTSPTCYAGYEGSANTTGANPVLVHRRVGHRPDPAASFSKLIGATAQEVSTDRSPKGALPSPCGNRLSRICTVKTGPQPAARSLPKPRICSPIWSAPACERSPSSSPGVEPKPSPRSPGTWSTRSTPRFPIASRHTARATCRPSGANSRSNCATGHFWAWLNLGT